jgi:hypothetical protein
MKKKLFVRQTFGKVVRLRSHFLWENEKLSCVSEQVHESDSPPKRQFTSVHKLVPHDIKYLLCSQQSVHVYYTSAHGRRRDPRKQGQMG